MMRRYFILVFLLVFLVPASAQTFHTKLLQSIAERLNLTEQLRDTTLTQVTTSEGRMLNVRFDGGQVFHLGIPLFSNEMRTLMPSPIYDYLEQALLDRLYHVSDNTLSLQKIKFYCGSWQSLETIRPTDICNISNLEGKQYVVSWIRDSEEITSLTIPVNYELLANSSRREMEESFARDLKNHRSSLTTHLPPPDEGQLVSYGKDSLLMLQGQSYLRPFITRNTYYRMQSVTEREDTIAYEETLPVLVADRRFPQETMANLLLTSNSDCQLELEMQRSDYRRETIRVSLKQWLSFCQKEGCTPYFAFEDVYGEQAAGMVIMHNAAKGYDHLLYLECPLSTLDSGHPLMAGKLYLYLPNNNISNLFAETPASRSLPKIFTKP
jgi:hypothetical protein